MHASPSPIALITGGSRGLGRNAALHLARQGTDVILTYRSARAEAEQVVAAIEAEGRRAAALPLDVADSSRFPAFAAQVQAVLAGWDRGHIDFLLNNAGHGTSVPFIGTTEAQFDALFQVHLKAPFFLVQALLPLIADGGRILNVSSGLARFTLPGYAAYAAMKGGVEVLTRYLARELGDRRITVNTLAPGAIETDFGGGQVRDDQGINAHIAALTALGRVGLPDDIGGVVAALLSPGAGWINGQRIEASGGMLL
jgi:NAD(P)-dependent dehydrogenase (short-subunit alcohol dehydrogenase family)